LNYQCHYSLFKKGKLKKGTYIGMKRGGTNYLLKAIHNDCSKANHGKERRKRMLYEGRYTTLFIKEEGKEI